MTIKKTIFLMALISVMNIHASYSAKESHPCIIQFENGDKRELILLNQSLSNIWGGDKTVLEFTEYMSKEKINIETKDIYSLTFTAGEKPITYRYVHAYKYLGLAYFIPKILTKNKVALIVEHEDDNITVLYEEVITSDNSGTTYHDYFYFLPKGHKDARMVFYQVAHATVIGWAPLYRKQLAHYFKDCPSMVQRIKNKEFDLDSSKDFNVQVLVDVYNEYLEECKQ